MIALADLRTSWQWPGRCHGKVWYDPFWLTVEHGAVTAMEEQFLPWTDRLAEPVRRSSRMSSPLCVFDVGTWVPVHLTHTGAEGAA
jgi:hypothetical protein